MSSSWYGKIFKLGHCVKSEEQQASYRHRTIEENLQALESLQQASGQETCWEDEDSEILHSRENAVRRTILTDSPSPRHTGASQAASDPNSHRPCTRSLSLRLSLERVPSRIQPDEDEPSSDKASDEGDQCKIDCWNGSWRGFSSSNQEAVQSYDTRSLCEQRVHIHVLRLFAQL